MRGPETPPRGTIVGWHRWGRTQRLVTPPLATRLRGLGPKNSVWTARPSPTVHSHRNGAVPRRWGPPRRHAEVATAPLRVVPPGFAGRSTNRWRNRGHQGWTAKDTTFGDARPKWSGSASPTTGRGRAHRTGALACAVAVFQRTTSTKAKPTRASRNINSDEFNGPPKLYMCKNAAARLQLQLHTRNCKCTIAAAIIQSRM